MKKLSIITVISLLFLSIPLALWAQLDRWLMEEMFFENSEPEIILSSKTFELFWSTNSYAPFGYQGRRLATSGSKVTVYVYLDVLGGNTKNLKYSWFLDGIFQESKSGYGQGKFEFTVKRSNNASHAVLLKVFNESRSFLKEKSITIPISDPEIVIYPYVRQNSGAGVNLPYATSAKDFDVITNKEATFLALPYFFNIKYSGSLEFDWTFNDEAYKDYSLTANIFGLKIINKKTGGSLEKTLKVVATNKRPPIQKAEKTVRLSIY